MGDDGVHGFSQAWSGDNFPRMIAVTFQHPTPFFDDSYAVNSANNGPYGDALMQELIPYLEEHFRIIRQPWARMLTGGSTGGWESLALEFYHPDFFGGTSTGFPIPSTSLITNYRTSIAIPMPLRFPVMSGWPAERPLMRTPEGQVVETVRQMSQLEDVLGSHGRSGQQYEAWEVVYGPVGPDGYPEPLWDKRTGVINHKVADYMRDHGYDLREYADKNWSKIGPCSPTMSSSGLAIWITTTSTWRCMTWRTFSTSIPQLKRTSNTDAPRRATDGSPGRSLTS